MANKEVIQGYDPDHLECRFGRHWMYAKLFYREQGHVVTLLECRRPGCGVTAYDLTNFKTGKRVKSRTYQYPEGYIVPGGLSPSEVRVERFRRAKNGGEISARPDGVPPVRIPKGAA